MAGLSILKAEICWDALQLRKDDVLLEGLSIGDPDKRKPRTGGSGEVGLSVSGTRQQIHCTKGRPVLARGRAFFKLADLYGSCSNGIR